MVVKQVYTRTKMNIQEFQQTVVEATDKINKVLVAKRKEYTNNDDPFHNFRAATGVSLHNTKEAVAYEFLVKHLQSFKDIITFIEDKNYTNIDKVLLDEKAIDIINYVLLIRGMIIDRIDNQI